MPRSIDALSSAETDFLTQRHLGALTTLRADGTPHVVAIAFTVDREAGLVHVISSDESQKVVNIERDPRAAVCQVDGARWLTLEGSAVVTRDPKRVQAAVQGFKRRYRPAGENPRRVAIEITVERVLGRV
jgi:PPOX class probable F420-dependent enzyme